jgi:putative SOS response-associated peptidase YedK
MTYTIITTKANKQVARVHKRMPVILTREEEERWLEKETDKDELLKMLDSYESKTFESIRVSQRVNKPENNDAELIREVEN